MGALHDGGVVFHDGHGQLGELGIDELAFGGRGPGAASIGG